MSYKLVVVSPIELKKIYVKVAKDAMRDTAQRIALKEDFYPADHKIEIVLPRLPSVGLYAVEVTGEGDNRRTTTTGTFLIRHSQ